MMPKSPSGKFNRHTPYNGERYQFNDYEVEVEGLVFNEELNEYEVAIHDIDGNTDIVSIKAIVASARAQDIAYSLGYDQQAYWQIPIKTFRELLNSGEMKLLDDGVKRAIRRLKIR